MNKQYKDTDLREALRRKFADTPQLPADFMNNMERKMNPTRIRPVRRWWWIAAAASVLLIIGIGVTMMPTEESAPAAPQMVAKAESPKPSAVVANQEEPIEEQSHRERPHDSNKNQKPVPMIPRSVISAEPEEDPNLHYAAIETTKDTVPYQDPARVDQFIAKLAGYYHVKQGELLCSVPIDSNTSSSSSN